MSARPNSIVLWEGVSAIDGARLVCVATGLNSASTNAKTGALVQTWILLADGTATRAGWKVTKGGKRVRVWEYTGVSPKDAIGLGRDVSTCGGCPHRPFNGGACYVNVGQAPLSVWRAWVKGVIPRRGDAGWAEAHARLLGPQGLPLRAGSYGDPALVPLDVWARMNVVTGYTHQWRMPFAAGHRAYMMASCDGPGDLADARAQGWRCFVVTPQGAPVPEGAIACPSSRGVQCADCRLCGGLQRAGARDIAIEVHGFRVSAQEHGMERSGPSRLAILQ